MVFIWYFNGIYYERRKKGIPRTNVCDSFRYVGDYLDILFLFSGAPNPCFFVPSQLVS